MCALPPKMRGICMSKDKVPQKDPMDAHSETLELSQKREMGTSALPADGLGRMVSPAGSQFPYL